MQMFTKIRIKKHERGLWFRHGDFRKLLQPARTGFGAGCGTR